MAHSPEFQSAGTNELGYSEGETLKLLTARERLLGHVDVLLVLVGGLSNRAQFPQYTSSLQEGPGRGGDLDFVFDSAADRSARMVRSSIMQEFAVTHIIEDNGAYYFRVVDRATAVKADLFVAQRPIRTHTIDVHGTSMLTQLPEESYLKTMRDLYRFLSQGRQLPAKHAKFFAFADTRIDRTVVDELWPQEQPLIGQDQVSFADYRTQVLTLITAHADLLTNHDFKMSPQYPSNSPTIFGVSVVPEAEWQGLVKVNDVNTEA